MRREPDADLIELVRRARLLPAEARRKLRPMLMEALREAAEEGLEESAPAVELDGLAALLDDLEHGA